MSDSNIDPKKLAEWLVIGFARHQRLLDVVVSAGLGGEDFARIKEAAPFFPSSAIRAKTPVRAYVAQCWPKLSEFLLRNSDNPQKMLSVVPQLMKLKANEERQQVLSAADVYENAKASREMRRTQTLHSISRTAFKTHGRSAWNVCK